jgi:phage terminase small subunit
MDEKKKLTPKQKRFVAEYVKEPNGKKAAIKAGYSKKCSKQSAHENLTKPYLKEAVENKLEAVHKKIGLDTEKILKELLRIATSDLRQAFKEDGTLKPIHELPDDIAKAISGVEVDETFEGHGLDRTWTGYTKKLKLWDKNKSLEMLAKHLKLLVERIEISKDESLIDRYNRACENAEQK